MASLGAKREEWCAWVRTRSGAEGAAESKGRRQVGEAGRATSGKTIMRIWVILEASFGF